MVVVISYLFKMGAVSTLLLYLGAFMWVMMGFGTIIYAFTKTENRRSTM